MSVIIDFVSKETLVECCSHEMSGRLLSINIGKNMCMGVIHIAVGYCMFSYRRELFDKKRIYRGDVIYFNSNVYEHKGKYGIEIIKINRIIECKGVLPNKQYKGECENNRIVQCMFEPEKYAIISGYSKVIRELRLYLYENGFDEVNSPVLYQLGSPSNAECFFVNTVNNQKLFLKSIHEHLVKPYLLIGFDKVFEIGSVFRNIRYSHEYDCEFHNLDIWKKNSSLEQLIDLCINITNKSSTAIEISSLSAEIYSFNEYVEKNQLKNADDKSVKEHIKSQGSKCITIIKEPLRVKNYHVKETTDGMYNQEFHAYINGISYAHGYCVKTEGISVDTTLSDEKCQLFEEYAEYGIEDFGGVGIGLEKMLQGLFEINDYHLLSLYRRKY